RRRDGSDPIGGELKRAYGVRIGDGHDAFGIDDPSAILACEPFQGVAGQTFVSPSLPDETPEPCIALLALGLLNAPRRFSQLCPSLRRPSAIGFEEVSAVVKHAKVEEPGQRLQCAIDGIVLNQEVEMLAFGAVRIGLQIDKLFCEDAGPDDVYLED